MPMRAKQAIPRSRTPALIIGSGKDDFPELVRTLRKKADAAVIGNAISRMRQSKNGQLIDISGDTGAAEKVRAEVERSLGPDVPVKKVERLHPIEVRDLDAETNREELLQILSSLGDPGVRVVSLRASYGGTQTAVIMATNEVAKRLCETGRVRVGLVYARVRLTELLTRCYCCLAYEHMSRVFRRG